MKSIPYYFEYLFDIKPNEISKSLVLQLYIFILITTLLLVKPTVNSIFLTELGTEALPIAYLFTALAAVIFSRIYNTALNHFSLKQVIRFTLFACVGILLAVSFVLLKGVKQGNWLYVPYVFVAIFGLLTTSQFWLLSNLIFNIRQAKRIFGFIGAGAIAGGIFGGYFASILSNYIRSEFLLVIAACLLFICIPINHFLWKKHIPLQRRDERQKNELEAHPIRLIKQSKLLTYMTYAIAIGVIVAKFVDYQYSHFATERLTNTEELTAFFGFWFSTFSIISLIIQVFFTQKIIRRIGLGKSIGILPLGIVLGSILLLFVPELWVVVLIKLADGSLKQSVHKASVELLYMPIAVNTKKRTKIFTDVVVDSIATGLAGLLLIFVIHGLAIDPVQISYFTISLIIIWLFIIGKINRQYLIAVKNLVVPNGKNSTKAFRKAAHEKFNLKTENLKTIYTTGSESQLKYVLHHIDHTWNHSLDVDMLPLLKHPSTAVKTLVVHHLYYNKTIDATQDIRPFLNSADEALIIESARYIIHKTPGRHPQVIADLQEGCPHENAHILVRYAAALEFENDIETQKHYHLHEDVLGYINEMTAHDAANFNSNAIPYVLEMIGLLHLKAHYPLLATSISDPSTAIAKGAANGMGFTRDPDVLKDLLKGVSQKPLRPTIQKIIQQQSPKVLNHLTQAALDYGYEHNISIQIPELIAHYQDHKSIKALTTIIEDGEYSVSIKAIDSLLELSQRYPEAKTHNSYISAKIIKACKVYENLLLFIEHQLEYEPSGDPDLEEARQGLVTLLQHRLDSQLDRIFKLIGIRYPKEALGTILKASVSEDNETHSNAIEYIDNLIDRDLKTVLFPVIDAARLDNSNRHSQITSHNQTPFKAYDAYAYILKQHDTRLKHAVLHLIKHLNSKAFLPLIEAACCDADPSISAQAKALKKSLN